MASQKGVLDAAVADLKDAQATVEKEIQEELLGTDAAGTNYCGDPVNMTTGNFVYDREDLVVGGDPFPPSCRLREPCASDGRPDRYARTDPWR